MAKDKILIVDDEMSIRMALRTAFKRENMITEEASNGTDGLTMIRTRGYDLVVLDIMLQDVDGYTILQTMRSEGITTPVLILSGRQEEVDQVMGLCLGADDYLTKPFHVAVLIQKVKALIRRSKVYDQQNSGSQIVQGPFTFDLVKLQCSRDGHIIDFTGKELALFRFFMEHPNQVFTKEQLYNQVWNENIVDDNTIMVYIKRVREKIGDSSRSPRFLRTVRGVGYVFHAE